jgi:hypothetical protein
MYLPIAVINPFLRAYPEFVFSLIPIAVLEVPKYCSRIRNFFFNSNYGTRVTYLLRRLSISNMAPVVHGSGIFFNSNYGTSGTYLLRRQSISNMAQEVGFYNSICGTRGT